MVNFLAVCKNNKIVKILKWLGKKKLGKSLVTEPVDASEIVTIGEVIQQWKDHFTGINEIFDRMAETLQKNNLNITQKLKKVSDQLEATSIRIRAGYERMNMFKNWFTSEHHVTQGESSAQGSKG